MGSQLVVKQRSLLVQSFGVPGKHLPLPSQVSSPLQALPSVQDVPTAKFSTPQLPALQMARWQGLTGFAQI